MQAPKSILMHLDSSARTAERVKFARHLAEAFDAQVTALYATVPYLLRYPMSIEGGAQAFAMLDEADQQERETAQAIFKTASADSPLLKWLGSGRDAVRDFARRAYYCDLMILGQRNPDDSAGSALPPSFLSDLLLDTGKPALVLPYVGSFATLGSTVLIAWKESREAASAVSAALPWLHRAGHVHVVGYGDAQDESLKSMQSYLVEQGITATAHRGGPEGPEIGDRLLSLATDLSADLLVMGCYGRSRAREWVLGGATRSILDSMTLPVLMAH